MRSNNTSRELPKGVYELPQGTYKAVTWEPESYKQTHIGVFDTPEEAEYARNVKLNGHHWINMPEGSPEKDWGFVYLITNKKNGKLYVGKKQFLWWNGPPGGYKCTDRSNKEWFTPSAWRESDWRTYCSSCIPLQKDIQKYGVHNFSFEVLHTHAKGKLPLHFAETKEMMERDVLEAVDSKGAYIYYNSNIASLEFRAPFRKDKVSAAMEETMSEMEQYYLKPTVCRRCYSVVPFGHTTCKECA